MAPSTRRVAEPDLPAKLRLADRMIDGGIEAWLRERIDAGASWSRMSDDLLLATNGDLRVAVQTLQRWAALLGIEAKAAS